MRRTNSCGKSMTGNPFIAGQRALSGWTGGTVTGTPNSF
jgi:hypothetical protein